MAMAGYGNISATAYMIKKGIVLNTAVREKPDIITESNCTKKIFISTYLNKFRIIGCIDSGSDITILQLSRYDCIFKSRNYIIPADIEHITTFSDNTIPVLGVIHTNICLSKTHPGIKMTIYIVHCPRYTKCSFILIRQ
jgi:hypothetical protein